MSLDGKFDDESWIDLIDRDLTAVNKKIATVWQDKTHYSKRKLERILHVGGASGLGIAGLNINYFYLIPSAFFGLQATIPEEMLLKKYPDSKIDKYNRVVQYSVSAFSIMFGIGNIATGVINNDNSRHIESANWIALGLGIASEASAQYMRKIDMDEPPPRKKKKSISERVKEKFREILPSPEPQPVPAEYS